MLRRPLGRTGEEVSLLGLGGYHLLEIMQADADRLIHRYLDAGGNYLETAASYGKGDGEAKIGRALRSRRDRCLLATKVDAREKDAARATLDRSLRNLRTDHIDIWFMHAVQSASDADRLLETGGALEAADEARQAGKIRFIGITGHGQPEGMLRALPHFPFEALMVPINYYDHFNFPDVQARLLPLAQARGCAVIGMKAVGDGYLWRSAAMAFRYAWSQPVSHVVAGCNTLELLDADIACAEAFTPMTPEEIQSVYDTAPEYRGYICRQCPQCQVVAGLHLSRIFELEGWFDRQMWDGIVIDPEDYALRVRLGTWFGQQQLAREQYAREPIIIDPEADYSDLNGRCTHQLDINRKLKIAHAKLSSHWELQ